MNKELFLSEAVFAKLVHTPEGPGILVAGEVFRIVPPAGVDMHSKEPFASWVVSALRNGPHTLASSPDVVGITPGRTVAGLANTYGVAAGKAGAA
jgi:hypothetical protein